MPVARTITERSLADAIREYNGNISLIAKCFGYTRNGISSAIQRRPKLVALLAEAREVKKDLVEDVFMRNCLDPSPQFQPSRFKFLFTQARDRGYVDKQEVELSGPGGGPVVTEIVIEHHVAVRRQGELADNPPLHIEDGAPVPELPIPPVTDTIDVTHSPADTSADQPPG